MPEQIKLHISYPAKVVSIEGKDIYLTETQLREVRETAFSKGRDQAVKLAHSLDGRSTAHVEIEEAAIQTRTTGSARASVTYSDQKLHDAHVHTTEIKLSSSHGGYASAEQTNKQDQIAQMGVVSAENKKVSLLGFVGHVINAITIGDKFSGTILNNRHAIQTPHELSTGKHTLTLDRMRANALNRQTNQTIHDLNNQGYDVVLDVPEQQYSRPIFDARFNNPNTATIQDGSFGTRSTVTFYGPTSPGDLVNAYKADLYRPGDNPGDAVDHYHQKFDRPDGRGFFINGRPVTEEEFAKR